MLSREVQRVHDMFQLELDQNGQSTDHLGLGFMHKKISLTSVLTFQYSYSEGEIVN